MPILVFYIGRRTTLKRPVFIRILIANKRHLIVMKLNSFVKTLIIIRILHFKTKTSIFSFCEEKNCFRENFRIKKRISFWLSKYFRRHRRLPWPSPAMMLANWIGDFQKQDQFLLYRNGNPLLQPETVDLVPIHRITTIQSALKRYRVHQKSLMLKHHIRCSKKKGEKIFQNMP